MPSSDFPPYDVAKATLKIMREDPASLPFRPFVPWAAKAFRFSKLEHLESIFSGQGSISRGGRWNPRYVEHPAVYLACHRRTAGAELDHWFDVTGAEVDDCHHVLCNAVIHATLLDLTSPDVTAHLGLTPAALLADWDPYPDDAPSPSQLFGLAACEVGWEGILYPSAQDPGGRNLVVFIGNLPPDRPVRLASKWRA